MHGKIQIMRYQYVERCWPATYCLLIAGADFGRYAFHPCFSGSEGQLIRGRPSPHGCPRKAAPSGARRRFIDRLAEFRIMHVYVHAPLCDELVASPGQVALGLRKIRSEEPTSELQTLM